MVNAKHILGYRRKRQGKTNYKKRLALLKSGRPRLVIRRSNKYLLLQIVKYQPDGDKVLLTMSSKALIKAGWKHTTKSISAAYFTGILLGRAATEQKIKEAIADFGMQKHVAGNRLCAAVKGAIDGGLAIPVGEETFPPPDRIRGKHLQYAKDVEAFATKLKITLPTAQKQAAVEAPAEKAKEES